MPFLYYSLYAAPFGLIRCDFADEALVAVHFPPAPATTLPQQDVPPAWQQRFDAYFSGSLRDFAQPVSSRGTPFQQQVWQAIAEIPYGQVCSYQDVARHIGSHPRAVGQACGRNPLAIVIPCHRVVSAHGLGGFNQGRDEATLAIKRWLLRHEGVSL